jgi:hypothetical protein
MSDIGQVSLKKPATLLALDVLGGGGNSKYDSSYQEILDYATSQGFDLPSPQNQRTQNALLINLKSSGIWELLDVFYNFFTDGDADFAKINWKEPGAESVSSFGAPVFTVNSGFSGFSGTSYLLSYNPSTFGGNYSRNSATMFAATPSVAGVNSILCGSFSFTFNTYEQINIFAGYYILNSLAPAAALANTNVAGLHHVDRQNSTNSNASINGLSVGAIVQASTALINNRLSIGARNDEGAGPGSLPFTGTVEMFGAGSSVDGKQFSLYSAWNDYKHHTIAVTAYKKILAYANVQDFVLPTGPQRGDQIRLITELSRAGIWENLDIFYNFLNDGSAGFAKINWKNPGTFQADGVGHEPTFTINSGFDFDGTSQYFNTQWTPSTNGVKFTLNDASFGVDQYENASADRISMGASDGVGAATINTRSLTNQVVIAINDNSPFNIATVVSSAGFTLAKRVGTTKSSFKTGSSIGSTTTASTQRPTFPLFIGAINQSGVAAQFSTRGTLMAYAGASLNSKEAAFNTAWATYRNKYLATVHPYDVIIKYANLQGFTVPSAGQQDSQRALIDELVLSGVWDLLDVFYNFVTDGDHNFAKINWKQPGSFQAVGTGHEPLFITNVGFKGNGTTAYLDTQWNPSVNGVNYTLSLASAFAYIYDSIIETKFDFGTHGTVSTGVLRYNSKNLSAGVVFAINNASVSNGVSGPIGAGLSLINRKGLLQADVEFFRNGVKVVTTANVIGTIPDTAVFILASNLAGAANSPTTRTISSFGAGGNLFSPQSSLYTAWRNYFYPINATTAYNAILAYATSQAFVLPSAAQQVLGRQLILDLMNADIWDEIEVFYNFLTDGDRGFAKINWKAPGTFQAEETAGVVAFATNGGFTGNTAGPSFLNTTWIPANSQLAQLNSTWFSIAVNNIIPVSGARFQGCQNDSSGGDEFLFGLQTVANRVDLRINTGQFSTQINNAIFNGDPGVYQFWRETSTIQKGKKDLSAEIQTTTNQTTTGRPITPFYLLAYNVSPGSSGFSDNNLLHFAVGSQLSSAKRISFYNAWIAYANTPKAKAAYAAIIAYATGQGFALPSPTQQAEQENLILELINAGIWNELEVFYNFLTDGGSGFALINWKNPGTFNGVIISSTLFTPNKGFIGDGVFSIIDTQWRQSLSALTSLNNLWFAMGNDGGITISTTQFHGSLDVVVANIVGFNLQSAANTVNVRLNVGPTNGFITDPVFNGGAGIYQFWREDSAIQKAKKDNSAEFSSAVTSSIIIDQNFYLFALHGSGGFSAQTINNFAIGSQMTAAKRTDYNNKWKAYANPIRATVAYNAITAYATSQAFTLPSATQQTAGRQLILDLMNIGVWDDLDLFYSFFTDGDSGFARINWKAPGTFQALAQGTTPPTFVSGGGFTNTSITGFLNTQWTPSTNAKLLTQNSAWLSIVNGGGIVSGAGNFHGASGAGAANQLMVNLSRGTNTIDARINIASAVNDVVNTVFNRLPGVYQFWRESNTVVRAKKDASSEILLTTVSPSVALPSVPLWLLNQNNNGVVGGSGLETIYQFAIGSQMDATKRTEFYNKWNSFIQPLRATAAYNAITAYATSQTFTLPSAAQQTAGRQLILDLIVAGLWDKIEVLYNFVTDGDHNFAKINWKKPGTFQAVGTGHEPTFIPGTGFKGNGTTQYLSTQWTPSGTLQFQLNNCEVGIHYASSVYGSFFDGAFGGGNAVLINPQASNASGDFRINNNNSSINVTIAGIGSTFFSSRTTASGVAAHRNAAAVGTNNSTASTAIPTSPVFLCGYSVDGALGAAHSRTISMFFAGADLTNTGDTALFNAWTTYANPIIANAAYDAILAYATSQAFTLPSPAQQTKGRQLILDLVNANVWAELDVFYNFHTDGNAGFALINWKNPGTFQAVLVNAPVFTSNYGFTGDGLTSYINTTFAPSVSLTKTLNAMWFSLGARFGIVIFSTDFHGSTDGVNQTLFNLQTDANTIDVRISSSSGAINTINNVAFDTAPGLYQFWRETSTVIKAKKGDSAEFTSPSSVSSVLTTQPIFLLTFNNNGVPYTDPIAQTINQFAVGLQLNATARTAYYNAWNKYITP